MEKQFEAFLLKTLQSNEERAKGILQLLQNYGVSQLSDLRVMTDQDAEGIGIKPLQWKMLKQSLQKFQPEKTQVNQKENEICQNQFQTQNEKKEQKINLSNSILSDSFSLNRQQLVEAIKIAEQLERFTDMSEHMKKVINIDTKLTLEEVKLFWIAYKNIVGPLRAQYRVIQNLDQAGQRQQIIQDYKNKLEQELIQVCEEVINLLDNFLIKNAISSEIKVFYLKAKGDCYR